MVHRFYLATLICFVFAIASLITPSAQSQEEPVFFTADFNLTTDHSLRPDEDTVIFFTNVDGPDPAISQDTLGASGEPGDEALELLFEIIDPNFFGFLISLAPDGESYDISEFAVLEFDMRLGFPGGFEDWVIRLEDRDGDAEWNNVSLPIENITDEWQTYSFPLSDFTPSDGSQIVDLTQVFQIVFANGTNPGGAIFLDLLVDNVTIKGVGDNTPPAPAVPEPLDAFVADFEDGTLVNSNGGELFIRAAQGNPFIDELEQIAVEVVSDSLAEGGQAVYVSGGFEAVGDGFSYIEARFPLNTDVDVAHDISGFDTLQVVARLGDADNATWGVRMRDLDTVDSDFLNNTVFIRDQLSSEYSVINIPLLQFEQDTNGAAIDLTQVSHIFIVVDGGAGPLSLQSDLYIDELSLINETNVIDWFMY